MKDIRILVFVLVMLILMALCIVMLIKNEVIYRQRKKILKAIKEYENMCYKHGEISNVDCENIENYDSTLFRIWDWGYTRILPKDKFEIIKPYIK